MTEYIEPSKENKRIVNDSNGNRMLREDFRETLINCGTQGLTRKETMVVMGINDRIRHTYVISNEEKYEEYQISKAMPRVIAKRKILNSINQGNIQDCKRYLEKFNDEAEDKETTPSLINQNTYNLILQRINAKGPATTEYIPPTDEQTQTISII